MAQEISYHEGFAGNFRLLSFATGSYLKSCRICGKQFIGDKRAMSCLACAIDAAEAKFTSANKRRIAICRWKIDLETCSYDTSCGAKWCFPEGTPVENGLRYCPVCGKRASVR